MAEQEFTTQEIAEHAQGNAAALILATIAYFNEQGGDAAAWMADVGKRFALAWETSKQLGARGAMDGIALNVVAFGGTLQHLEGDIASAKATFAHWPISEDLHYFGITLAEADTFWTIFQTITEHLDLHYEWQREGNQVTITLSNKAV
jgi:hypothetical protein